MFIQIKPSLSETGAASNGNDSAHNNSVLYDTFFMSYETPQSETN